MPGELIAILIIIGSIILFTVTFILNRKLKSPEETELPEGCANCHNFMCKQKLENKIEENSKSKIDMTPDELIKFMNCEEKNNAKK